MVHFDSFRHFCSLKALSTGVQEEESRHPEESDSRYRDTDVLLRFAKVKKHPSPLCGQWNGRDLGNKNCGRRLRCNQLGIFV